MDVYIGIDGGGTKTRAIAATIHGKVLADITVAGSNVNRHGWERTNASLLNLFAALRSHLSAEHKVVSVFLGLAGVDRESQRSRMNSWVQEQWPGAAVRVENDAFPALVSSSGQVEGIVLISQQEGGSPMQHDFQTMFERIQ